MNQPKAYLPRDRHGNNPNPNNPGGPQPPYPPSHPPYGPGNVGNPNHPGGVPGPNHPGGVPGPNDPGSFPPPNSPANYGRPGPGGFPPPNGPGGPHFGDPGDFDGSDFDDVNDEAHGKKDHVAIALIVAIVVVALVLAGGLALFVVIKKGDGSHSNASDVPIAVDGIDEEWTTNVSMERTDNTVGTSYAAFNAHKNHLVVFTPNDTRWVATEINATTGKPAEESTELPACDNGLEQPYELVNGKPRCITEKATQPTKPFSGSNDSTQEAEPDDPGTTDDTGSDTTDVPDDSPDKDSSPETPSTSDNDATDDSDATNEDDVDKDEPDKDDAEDFLPDNTGVIYSDDELIIAIMPDALNGKAALGYSPDGDLLWSEEFDEPGVVGTDGMQLWVVTEIPDTNEVEITFYTPADKADSDASLPDIDTPSRDFLGDFDFGNSYVPSPDADEHGHWCFAIPDGSDVPLEKAVDEDTACWLKLADYVSVETEDPRGTGKDQPVLACDEDPEQWEDINGDGYIDAVIPCGTLDARLLMLVIANPKDVDHPYMGYLTGGQHPNYDYIGDGIWYEDIEEPEFVERGWKVTVHNKDGVPTISRERR